MMSLALNNRALVALTVLHLTEEFEILNSIPSLAHIFLETDHEIFSTVIFTPSTYSKAVVS